MRLSRQVALVTGGGTGNGAAIARRFSAEGASIVITGRRRDPLEAVAAETGATVVVGDVTSAEDVARAVSAAVDGFGGLDVVVNNAASSSDDFDEAIDVNLRGAYRVASAAIPHLVERGGGSIVNVASIAGLVAGFGATGYSTSKGGLIMLTRSLAVRHGRDGIRVNALCPGWVRTPMGNESMDVVAERNGVTREEAEKLTTAHVPLARFAEPDEIAAAALFLASADSSFVTGSLLVADGGATAVDVAMLAFAP